MLQIIQSELGRIDLSGSLTIHTAELLYRELKALPFGEDPSVPLRLNLEKITEIDPAGMQTLIAFKLSRQRDTVRFFAQEELRSRCRMCGLDKYLF